MEKEIEKSKTFWNETYKGFTAEKIDPKDVKVLPQMEKIFNAFTSKVETMIDFGCGAGDMIMTFLYNSNIKKACGIEKGENIVNYASALMKENGLADRTVILDGGTDALVPFKKDKVDGIIISNVLDVLTLEDSEKIKKELISCLKPGGLMIVKINPVFTKEDLDKMGFINFKDNLYSKDGVLRAREMPTSAWEENFKKDFDILDYALVNWQTSKFADRMWLLKLK